MKIEGIFNKIIVVEMLKCCWDYLVVANIVDIVEIVVTDIVEVVEIVVEYDDGSLSLRLLLIVVEIVTKIFPIFSL